MKTANSSFFFFSLICSICLGLLRWLCGRVHLPVQETQVHSLGWEHPLEQEIATHSLILPGEFCEKRSLEGYSPRHHKESEIATRQQQHYPYYFRNCHKVVTEKLCLMFEYIL